MPGGRPLKYNSPEEMADIIESYFHTLPDGEIPTMAGLAYALDITTETLRNYHHKDEFFATINKAKQRVTAKWESSLIRGGAGAIFWMKNNGDYKDKIINENVNRDATGISDAELEAIAAGRSPDTA